MSGFKRALYEGTIAGREGALRMTGQPIWRSSFDIEDPRAKVERPLGDGTAEGTIAFIRSWLITIEDYAEHIKRKGRAHEITANAIKLIRSIMWRCVDRTTGKCEVTLERIMQVSNFSRPTVVSLLKICRKHGLIDWVRRTEKTDNAPGEGPQVRQTANAYFFEVTNLPAEAYRRLKQRMAKNPPREYPERKGSGPVPNKGQRTLSKMVRSVTGHWRGKNERVVAQRRSLANQLAGSTPEEQAALIYPENPESQRQHLEMMRQTASSGNSPESPP